MQRTVALAIIFLTALTSPAADPARWRMEGKPDTAPGDALRVVGDGVTFSADVPGKFVYDPLTGKSTENRSSLAFKTGDQSTTRVEVPTDARAFAGSFTVEAFVKTDGDPHRTLVAFAKPRKDDKSAEFFAGPRFLKQFGQTYWGGEFAPPGSRREGWGTGPYTTIARLTKENAGWRHLAFVHDAEKKTVTVYFDYWQAAGRAAPAEMAWGDTPLCLGGMPEGNSFLGNIDEARFTPAALTPGQFLRVSEVPLEGVSFASEETVLPRETGYIDVKEGFGAVGDGKHDDTKAFQKAFDDLASKIPLAYYTLYVPPGNYVVTDTLRCSRFIVIQGAGPGKTALKLRDKAAGFGDPAAPKVVLRASSTAGPPESARGVNGSSIGLYIFGLTIDTGSGNPGAKALEYHSNNHGALEDAVLRSGDGSGVVGLDLTHRDVGPALVKNVTVEGFDIGVHLTHAEYSMTFEGLTLLNQRKTAFLNEGNIAAIRRLTSKNAVPALVSKGGGSMVVLLDSELAGGDAKNTAIAADGGLFVRGVKVTGYGASIRKTVETFKGFKEGVTREELPAVTGDIEEFVGDQVIAPRGGSKKSLNLPIEDAPEVPRGEIGKDWVNVRDFAARKSGDDWGPALQAAIDSGAKTVYLPQGGYEIATPVRLHGKVERLFGMRSGLNRAKSLAKTDPILIYDTPEATKVVSIERLDVAGLEHRSPGTLILRHTTPERFTNAKGAGKLFLEDIMGADWHFDHPQQVWARQWNTESHEAGPCIFSNGATIWSLGFKTEYQSSKLHAVGGAKTEILGGFIYPVNKGIPADRPVFLNRDSSMGVVYGLSFYQAGHDLQVRDEQAGDVLETRLKDVKQVYSRFRMDLYVSRPPAK